MSRAIAALFFPGRQECLPYHRNDSSHTHQATVTAPAAGDAAQVEAPDALRAARILFHQRAANIVDCRLLRKDQHAAAEAAADHARAVDAVDVTHDLDHGIEFRATDAIIVSQAGMRGIE